MIGPHIIGRLDDHKRVLKRWKPRVALLLDPSEGDARRFKQWSPDTFLIGRVFRSDGEIRGKIMHNPEEAGQWGAAIISTAAARNPEMDVWQFNNEVAHSNVGEIKKLNRFSVKYIELLAEQGLRAAIGCFAVGNPEAPQNDGGEAWRAFLPAMRKGMEYKSVLLLHSYGAPNIFDKDENWYIHRYERVVRPHLPDDVKDMPYVYGEYGCDMGVETIGLRKGWLTGYDANPQMYADDLERASYVLAKEGVCLGACVYTLGHTAEWEDFDINGLAAEALSEKFWPAPAITTIDVIEPVEPQPEPQPVAPPPVLEPATPPTPPKDKETTVIRFGDSIGIDANRPITDDGNFAPQVADPVTIADTGAGWVRLNFVIGPWKDVTDQTRHHGRTWEEAFRTLVDGYRSKGLKIYGLINCEALHPTDFGNDLRNPPEVGVFHLEWIDKYVETFVNVAKMFKNEVKIFESFNEPDDWHGAKPEWEHKNWVHPGWFAIMLERIYQAVRAEPELKDLKLVSGPVQGLTINANAGARYLRATYQEGKNRFGWGSHGKPYPFHGIGYHIYVEEGHQSMQEAAVQAKYKEYFDGLKRVIKDEEGKMKPIYVSEMGWHSNRTPEEIQSQYLRLGLDLAHKDPWVALAVWFCTQDFGESNGNHFYGLFNKTLSQKKAYLTFQTLCSRLIPAPKGESVKPAKPQPKPAPSPVIMPMGLTNQIVINAFNRASIALGLGNWGLMSRAKLSLGKLVKARSADYSGPMLAEISTLNDEQRELVRSFMPDDVDFASNIYGVMLSQWPDLDIMAMRFPDEMRIPLKSAKTAMEKRVARTWNRYGFLLLNVADILGIEAEIAVAVLATESEQRGIANDGRLLLRFEVNTFFEKWGQANPKAFRQHFRMHPDRPWQKHQWRPKASGKWRNVHSAHAQEWGAFEFARELDDEAALLSVGMGFPRIMGFNHAFIGYETVTNMYDAFSSSERYQLLAFFDLIAGPMMDSLRLQALREQNLETFAALNFGAQNAARYTTTLRSALDAFAKLTPLA